MHTPSEFDYTMLSTYMRCPKRYYYRMVRNLVGKVKPLAPEFGKWIHKALDVWFVERDMDKAIQVFKNNYVGSDSDQKRTVPVGEKLLRLYAEKYAHEGFTILESEKEFCVDLPTGDKLIGRIDKIIEWDNVIYVMDHKTTSRLGYEFFYKIKPNMQFDGYIYAARKMGYTACNGVLLDALLVAKGLLVPSQLSRLTPLARDLSTRSDEELQLYIDNVSMILNSVKNSYETEKWIMNTEGCCDFIECPYRKICKEEKDIQERIISMDYTEDKWDPREQGKGVS